MLGAHDARRQSRVLDDSRPLDRFLRQRIKDGEELHGESLKINGFTFRLAAALDQVIIDGCEYRQALPAGVYLDEDVKVRRVERLQIVDGGDGPPDGVLFDHPVFDHPVDNFESLFHTGSPNTLAHACITRLTND